MRLVMMLMKVLRDSCGITVTRVLHMSRLHCSSSDTLCVSGEAVTLLTCSLCSFWITLRKRERNLERRGGVCGRNVIKFACVYKVCECMCVCACMSACVRACVRACVHACVHTCERACVRMCMCVRAHV